MKLILTENQLRLIVLNSINEQKTVSSTDARTVSHKLLSSLYGLPDGENYENYLYSANVSDIIKRIGSFTTKTKLDMFKPYKPYSDKKNQYLDYFSINGEELKPIKNETISKTFDLIPNSTIVASHNGLLSLTRAMDRLTNKTNKITINFGKETDEEKGESERYSEYTDYTAGKAFNQSGNIKYILLNLVVAALNRNEYTLKFVQSQHNEINKNKDTLKLIIQNYVNKLIQGFYGFIPVQTGDISNIKVYENKISKLNGYIFNVDVSDIFNQMWNLQKEYDILQNEINQKKKNILIEVSSTLIPQFIEKLKNAYINNFNIFVNAFLPELKDEILPKINNVNFNHESLDKIHEIIFKKPAAGQPVEYKPNLERGKGYYDK